MHDVVDLRDLVAGELAQRRESGYDVSGLQTAVEAALGDGSAPLDELLDRLEQAPRLEDWPYEEPSQQEEILARLPETPPTSPRLEEAQLRERLLGAWLGRCAGCTLGKPVEGWTHDQIRRYLEQAGGYPLRDYLPVLEPAPEGLELRACWPETTRGRVRFMARDDDIDYTILGLHILERHGLGFGSRDVAAEWLDHLPFTRTYTAERVAYRNLVLGLHPPETATCRNPYREWIGAQIRGDMWGYVSPGNPRQAATLAFRDAAVSHTANGIYGEMWSAALIAACLVAPDVRSALVVSLEHIPPRARLTEALRQVLDLHASGLDWPDARDEIEARYGHYGWVHTINNAAVVAAGLLWGDGDFARTVGLVVQAGWDTDSNGATAGSVYGALHGATALPSAWVDPLGDLVHSAIAGFDNARISDLAERTLRLALRSPEGPR
jgi:ADP-ribosylglycohydrolase